MRSELFYYVLIVTLAIVTSSEPFTGKQLEAMNRISSPVLSLDGKYVVYSVRKWNEESGKSATNLQYTNINTNESGALTEAVDGQSDSSPLFTSALPNHLLFLRNNQIYSIEFPPKENPSSPVQLTKYPININDFKVKQNSIVFSADVYFNCTDLQCSADIIKVEKAATYQTYDKLLMFHWDHWLPQGKGSHLFLQKISLNKETNEVILDGDVKDLTQGMEINTPPLFTDKSNYDISNDGTKVAFSGHLRDYNEAWSTGWKTYYMDLDLMDKPELITKNTEARTQAPQFSKDGTKLAYLSMKTPVLESEFLHLEIYNILTNSISVISDVNFDQSISSFMWNTDSEIVFVSLTLGQNKLFKVNIKDVNAPVYSKIKTEENFLSYGLPFTAIKNRNVLLCNKVGYNFPERIVRISLDGSIEEKEIVNLNKELLETVELPQHEQISFTGGYNDTVYGWLIKPINFNEGQTYPVALLIHGGPESSWTSGWSYSWNPQMWANQGYVVVMINPHGSSGVSSKFQDAVRDDWGGVPYEDIMTGIKYVLENYKFTDSNKVCACGGSYGGYMVNWIQGNTDMFKCLVNHDGAFSIISKFYATEELWFPKSEFCPRDKIGCNPFDNKEIREHYERHSPERKVNNWKTPTLVIHGGNDMRVPLTEGLQTFTALQLKNVKSKFLFFPQENHWVLKPENQIKWFDEVFAWMKEYTS